VPAFREPISRIPQAMFLNLPAAVKRAAVEIVIAA
jgi:hypothetical protein